MDANEDYVRSVWVEVWDAPTGGLWIIRNRASNSFWLDISCATPEEKWSIAAEFTRERLEQARQKREDIALVRDSYQTCFNVGRACEFKDETRRKMGDEALVWMRIIDGLDSELARLTAGMKPEKAGSK